MKVLTIIYDALMGENEPFPKNPRDGLLGDFECDYDFIEEEDPVKERAYYCELYEEAKLCKGIKPGETAVLEPVDFFYQMISTSGNEGTEWEDLHGWWMLVDHKIAQLILMTRKKATTLQEAAEWNHLLVTPPTVLGTQVCYSDDQVAKCIEYIILKCKEYNLPVSMGNDTNEAVPFSPPTPGAQSAPGVGGEPSPSPAIMTEVPLDSTNIEISASVDPPIQNKKHD